MDNTGIDSDSDGYDLEINGCDCNESGQLGLVDYE